MAAPQKSVAKRIWRATWPPPLKLVGGLVYDICQLFTQGNELKRPLAKTRQERSCRVGVCEARGRRIPEFFLPAAVRVVDL